MKKVWDTQNNQPIYVLNESALHKRIQSKKNSALHITNVSELLAIAANIASGIFVAAFNFYQGSGSAYMYILAGWMLLVSGYVVVGRARRLAGYGRFDRSILGDLDFAIATAAYQVRLSGLLRWNMVPIGLLIIAGVWFQSRTVGYVIALLAFFSIAWYLSGWEDNYYKRRKREVEQLRNMLLTETDPK